MEQKVELIKKCDICASYANSLCYECLNYYCDTCSKFKKNKENNSKHKKEKIEQYVPIDTKCKKKKKNPLSLFCLEEKGN